MTSREIKLLRAVVHQVSAINPHICVPENPARDNTENYSPMRPLIVEVAATSQLDPTRQEYYDAQNRDHRSKWRTIISGRNKPDAMIERASVCENLLERESGLGETLFPDETRHERIQFGASSKEVDRETSEFYGFLPSTLVACVGYSPTSFPDVVT